MISPRALAHRPVQRRRLPGAHLLPDQLHPWIADSLHDCFRAVGRAVGDDDDLQPARRIIKSQLVSHRGLDGSLLVVGGDQNAHCRFDRRRPNRPGAHPGEQGREQRITDKNIQNHEDRSEKQSGGHGQASLPDIGEKDRVERLQKILHQAPAFGRGLSTCRHADPHEGAVLKAVEKPVSGQLEFLHEGAGGCLVMRLEPVGEIDVSRSRLAVMVANDRSLTAGQSQPVPGHRRQLPSLPGETDQRMVRCARLCRRRSSSRHRGRRPHGRCSGRGRRSRPSFRSSTTCGSRGIRRITSHPGIDGQDGFQALGLAFSCRCRMPQDRHRGESQAEQQKNQFAAQSTSHFANNLRMQMIRRMAAMKTPRPNSSWTRPWVRSMPNK